MQNTQLQPLILSLTLLTLSNYYGKKVALNTELNEFCFAEIVNDEVIYTLLSNQNEENQFGDVESFYFANTEDFKPLLDLDSTLGLPLVYPNSTLSEAINNPKFEIKLLPVDDFLKKDKHGKRIYFHARAKENLISQGISDKKLKKKSAEFENLTITKLRYNISSASKKNTHTKYLDYINLIDSDEENKLLVLDEMIEKLIDDTKKVKEEKIRAISRLNEAQEEEIKTKAKKEVKSGFKAKFVSSILVLLISVSAYFYFSNDSISNYINTPTLFGKIENYKTDKPFTANELSAIANFDKKEAKLNRQTFTNSEIDHLIDIQAVKANKKVWKFSRDKIKMELSNKKFTKWEANKIINKQISTIKK